MPKERKYDGNTDTRNTTKLFFLKFTSKTSGLVFHYGPFPSEDIVPRYYDAFGEWLKTQGDLDSVAIHHSKVKDLMTIYDPLLWLIGLREFQKEAVNG